LNVELIRIEFETEIVDFFKITNNTDNFEPRTSNLELQTRNHKPETRNAYRK